MPEQDPRELRRALVIVLAADIWDYLERFVARHELRQVRISITLAQRAVVSIEQSSADVFVLAAGRKGSGGPARQRRGPRLANGDVCERLRRRVQRLLRHIDFEFGKLHVVVDGSGVIESLSLAPLLRRHELLVWCDRLVALADAPSAAGRAPSGPAA